MSEHNTSTHVNPEEVSLKDLILRLLEFYREIIKNWKIVLLITIPFIAYFLYKAFTKPPTYPTELTFMINEDEGGGLGGAMSILNQFGLGGGGGAGKYNLDKILELSKTRKIIQSALFEKKTLNGSNDFIANHLIDIYNLHEKWENSKRGLQEFKFSHDDVETFELKENAALKALHTLIIGGKDVKGIYSTMINKESGIMVLKINSQSEQLSVDWLNLIYLHLSQFYINKSTEKQQATYALVKNKVDSLRTALSITESRLARFKDSNRGLWTRTAKLEEDRLNRNMLELSTVYIEASKNLEIADFTLKNKTPFIQLIDKPITPITESSESKIRSIFLGGFVGGLISAIFLIARKILRDTMNEEKV